MSKKISELFQSDVHENWSNLSKFFLTFLNINVCMGRLLERTVYLRINFWDFETVQLHFVVGLLVLWSSGFYFGWAQAMFQILNGSNFSPLLDFKIMLYTLFRSFHQCGIAMFIRSVKTHDAWASIFPSIFPMLIF